MGRPKKEKPERKPTKHTLEPRLDTTTKMMDVGGLPIPVTSTLTALLWGFGNHPSARAREYYFWRIADELWNHEGLPEKMFIKHPWAEKIIHECINNKYLSVGGSASSGKCLAPGTLVRMASGGTRKAKDIVKGDWLCGDDGTVRVVTGTCTGSSNMVRVKPKWGDPWECNDDHILTLKRTWAGRKSQRRVGDIIDISVRDYLATSSSFKKQHRLFKACAQFPAQPVPIEPRLYGLWLADGDKAGPVITSSLDEIEVTKFLSQDSGSNSFYNYASYGAPKYRFTKNPAFCQLVRDSTASGIKRLDRRYIENSEEVRMLTLAGMIDGDGHADANTHFTITQRDRLLLEDFKELADSLGFSTSRIRSRKVSCPTANGIFHGTAHMLRISGDLSRIPTLRKKTKARSRRVGGEEPFEIEQLGVGEWSGFAVDGNHRFLLADGTVTHNSHTLAGYGIISWLSKPRDTLVLMTSTTLREARKRIWGSVISLLSVIEGAPVNIRDSTGSANYIDANGQTFDRAGLSLIAAERSRTKEAIGKFIGLKQKHVILIADELGELSEAIVQAGLSNLSKNPKFELKALSNPASRFDAFGIWSTPRDGWESVRVELDDTWVTKWNGKYIRLDGERSPNIMAGETIYNFLPTQEKVDEDKALLGEKSRSYMRMVRAVFFDSDESEGIYSESELVNAGAMKRIEFKGATTLIAGLDPAFTNGGDRTMLCIARVGFDTNGQYCMQFEDFVQINDDSTNKAVPRTYQIVHKVKEECEKRGIKPENLAVDSTGAGSPLCDVLAGEWSNDFLRVPFGGKASDRRVSMNSQLIGEELYCNRVSELWFVGKEFIRTKQLTGVTAELAKEMANRRFELVKGSSLRVKVEPKGELKARAGASPDMADCAFVCLDLARQRHGLVAVDPPKSAADGLWPMRRTLTMKDLDIVSKSTHSQLIYD
jgi:hypothetical protein